MGDLGGGRTVVGTHVLDDLLQDEVLLALLEGVGEHLNGEVADNGLENGLVGRDTSLREGRNFLTNPGDQDELGTSCSIKNYLLACKPNLTTGTKKGVCLSVHVQERSSPVWTRMN